MARSFCFAGAGAGGRSSPAASPGRDKCPNGFSRLVRGGSAAGYTVHTGETAKESGTGKLWWPAPAGQVEGSGRMGGGGFVAATLFRVVLPELVTDNGAHSVLLGG